MSLRASYASRWWPVAVLGTAFVYFAAAKLGLSMAFVAEQVTPVWPPTGIALALVLLFGWPVVPGIALGAFAANATTNEPIATATGIAIGNTLEAVIGAQLLHAVGFRVSLERLRDVLALVALSAGVSTTVSATIGVASLCLGGVQSWSVAPTLWWVWWLGDAMGALVVAPPLLAWAAGDRARVESRAGEAGILALTVAAVGLIAFASPLGMRGGGYPLHYTIFPVVVWAALRFRQVGAATVTLVASGIAIWSTVHGQGPFAMAATHESLIMLQLFLAVVAVTGLLLAAAISERDLAARRAADEYAALRASEARLRLALDVGRMGVWEWNIASAAVECSDNLEAICGFAPGEFDGTFEVFWKRVHPDDRERVGRALDRAMNGEDEYDAEFRIIWPDASVHWMVGKGTVFRDRAGRPERMVGLGMDVTTRHRLEEEIRERVRELNDADRRKDEFLATLAHELRNPLAPLSNALHLLRLDETDRHRLLETADRQVKLLARLVDDLLDVSRITRGKITLREERVVVSDLIAQAVESAQPLIDARALRLTVSVPPEPIALIADPARLAQVLTNLLTNAASYTPQGGSISLTAAAADDSLLLKVRDTGIGMAPELAAKAFDLFVQGDASLERTRGGLGIGLTVVRHLVEMHDGSVEAHSEGQGRGAEFLIRLPLATPTPARAQTVPSPSPPPTHSRKLLVVEDNADASETLAAVLRLWGHEVRVSADALDALEVAGEFRPDVVLSDLGLPGMSGYDLAHELRQHPELGSVMLIALSGYGREEDARRARDAGFDHHLVKPPDLARLAALLGRATAAVT